MADAPERLWLWPEEPEDGAGKFVSFPDQPYPSGSAEYIRADVARAITPSDALAEMQRLREDRDALVAARDMLGGLWAKAVAERDALKSAQIEAIRAALEEAAKAASIHQNPRQAELVNAEEKPMQHVDSASDDRTANNAVRHKYRVLTDEEKQQMVDLKDLGAAFIAKCQEIGGSRELELAITNAEQAVMWAVKHVTK